MAEGRRYDINIITKGGAKTGYDVEIRHPINIQKDMSSNAKYDPSQQKEFFKSLVNMFKIILVLPTHKFMEPSFKLTPQQPRITKYSFFQLEFSGKSQNQLTFGSNYFLIS
jgi:hypothetical protein